MPGEEMVLGDGLETDLTGAGEGSGEGTGANDDGLENLAVGEGEEDGAGTGEGEGEGTGEGEGEGEGEAKEEPAGGKNKEVLPAALAKAVRELKSAHPEQAGAIKELNSAYYSNRAYKDVYPTVDDARTAKAAMEAIGGTEGITKMRETIEDIEAFDQLFEEGNPKVLDGLSQQFPDGFKLLVPAALDRLSKVDPESFRDTLRGPLLGSLEGAGLVDAVRDALHFMKLASTEPDAATTHYRSAQQRISQIEAWYNILKQQDTEFKTRYKDPKLQQLEGERVKLREDRASLVRDNVGRDLLSHLNSSLRPEISKMLNGRTLSEGGRARFEKEVRGEVSAMLNANAHYKDTLKNLIRKGSVEAAVRFAKPFLDTARSKALRTVYTDMFGNTAQAATKKPANGARATTQTRTQTSNTPVMVTRKPNHEEVDWDKDPRRTLFITGKAYLRGSGKFVTWKQD